MKYSFFKTLREAKDYAAREVEFENNMHVAECFAVQNSLQVQPNGLVKLKVNIKCMSVFWNNNVPFNDLLYMI